MNDRIIELEDGDAALIIKPDFTCDFYFESDNIETQPNSQLLASILLNRLAIEPEDRIAWIEYMIDELYEIFEVNGYNFDTFRNTFTRNLTLVK